MWVRALRLPSSAIIAAHTSPARTTTANGDISARDESTLSNQGSSPYVIHSGTVFSAWLPRRAIIIRL